MARHAGNLQIKTVFLGRVPINSMSNAWPVSALERITDSSQTSRQVRKCRDRTDAIGVAGNTLSRNLTLEPDRKCSQLFRTLPNSLKTIRFFVMAGLRPGHPRLSCLMLQRRGCPPLKKESKSSLK